RAVDPNEDGDAHDAARIALVALAAPYAAFADAPDARAVEGALDLDTLVVAAAGNDGPAGPAFGSLSSPGASPAALSVRAAAPPSSARATIRSPRSKMPPAQARRRLSSTELRFQPGGSASTRAFPFRSSPSRTTSPARRSTPSRPAGIRPSRSERRASLGTAPGAVLLRFRRAASRSTGASAPTSSPPVSP